MFCHTAVILRVVSKCWANYNYLSSLTLHSTQSSFPLFFLPEIIFFLVQFKYIVSIKVFIMNMIKIKTFRILSNLHFSVATKPRRSSKLWSFLSEDLSSSSSSIHFQMLKNLRSFEDFRSKIAKIFWENLTIFLTKLLEKV